MASRPFHCSCSDRVASARGTRSAAGARATFQAPSPLSVSLCTVRSVWYRNPLLTKFHKSLCHLSLSVSLLFCVVGAGSGVNVSSCCGEANPHECYGGCCLACNGPVMDPRSRCVGTNSSHSKCPLHPLPKPPPPPLPPPPPPRPCTPERLASGIQLPCPWPPLLNMTRETTVPHYIRAPPAAINIDDGRQLWVDDFLVDTEQTSAIERECLLPCTSYMAYLHTNCTHSCAAYNYTHGTDQVSASRLPQ